MNILAAIMRHLTGERSDPMCLDNVPVSALDCVDWRDEAVKKAAERHGKPFLCAADGVPRERFVGVEKQIEVVRPKATVTAIDSKRKKNLNAKEK